MSFELTIRAEDGNHHQGADIGRQTYSRQNNNKSLVAIVNRVELENNCIIALLPPQKKTKDVPEPAK